MILYKPTKQLFQNRKEAKKALGVAFWHRLEREKKDIEFIPDNITELNRLATNERTKQLTI